MVGMNEIPPESRPSPQPDPDQEATQALPAEQRPAPDAAPDAAATPAKQRLWDRVWSFRAVIAVALASVIIGGLGGAALANVGQDDDERPFPGQGRFDQGGPGGPPRMMQDRRRERMEQWRRGMGQRQWDQDGPPGVPPPGLPTPPAPSPTTG